MKFLKIFNPEQEDTIGLSSISAYNKLKEKAFAKEDMTPFAILMTLQDIKNYLSQHSLKAGRDYSKALIEMSGIAISLLQGELCSQVKVDRLLISEKTRQVIQEIDPTAGTQKM